MIFIDDNASGNIVCKMSAILLRLQFVYISVPQQAWTLIPDDWIIFKENICVLIYIK